VAEHKTKLGQCEVLTHNPYNGVLAAGHGNGTVTMWSPNMSSPLVKLLSHRGPVRMAWIATHTSVGV
jgi:U3 small nucleolar RNA-associated protein 7